MKKLENRGRKKYNYKDSEVPTLLPILNGKYLHFNAELIPETESRFIGSRVLPEFGYLLDKYGGFGTFSSMDEDKTNAMLLSSMPKSFVNVENLGSLVSLSGANFSVVNNFEPKRIVQLSSSSGDVKSSKSCKCKQQDEPISIRAPDKSSSTEINHPSAGGSKFVTDEINLDTLDSNDFENPLLRKITEFPNIASSELTNKKFEPPFADLVTASDGKQRVLLTAVETYFLTDLGFLTLNEMCKDDLFKSFSGRMRCFEYLLCVFYYYRSKGWVVRPGQTFGCDYLLYKHGQSFTHSTYGVLIQCIKVEKSDSTGQESTNLLDIKCVCCLLKSESTTQTDMRSETRCLLNYKYKPTEVSATCRTLNVANKDLIICNVTKMNNCDTSCFNVRNFDVNDVCLTRWVPK